MLGWYKPRRVLNAAELAGARQTFEIMNGRGMPGLEKVLKKMAFIFGQITIMFGKDEQLQIGNNFQLYFHFEAIYQQLAVLKTAIFQNLSYSFIL